ncbi:hypothetical protein PHLGIDRAFT_321647, partial [Phlebiopsis gigantea 11061_1 CR5-6]
MAPPPPPPHPMHVDARSMMRLRPIDTTPSATMRGSPHPPGAASSPVSAGGVHVSTMGMYNMHLGEGEDPAFPPHLQPFAQGAFLFSDPPPPAHMQQQQFGHFSRGAFERQQHQAYFAGAFEAFDPAPFAAHSPHSPHPLAQDSPAHSSLSPALSDFRAASEYGGGGSSGSASSRGASVSSGSGGSGRGQSLTRMGAWSPRPGSGADTFAFGHYGLGVKTEFSELGNALGTQSALALPGLAEVVGEAAAAAAQGEEEEDLSGYLPMPPIPVETETDPRPCSAGDDLRRRGHAPPAPQQQQPVQQHGVGALGAFDPGLYDDAADGDAGAFYVALPHEGGFAPAGACAAGAPATR